LINVRRVMEKKIICDWKNCGKTFNTKRHIDNHKNIHTGERPYKCDYIKCFAAFKGTAGLWEHKKIHPTNVIKKKIQVICKFPFCSNISCKIHVVRKHELNNTYRNMQQRTTNKNDCNYHNYGGRGIKMCQSWLDNFWDFVLDMGPRPKGYQIDRIDPDGDYSPGNCRWVSPKENINNRRISRKYKHKYKMINIELLPPKLWEKIQYYQNKNTIIKKIYDKINIPGQLSII
jgi:hypothetical protein